MVKSVLGVNHQGLTDWIIQRVSAIYMATYVIGLTLFFVFHPNLQFDDWHNALGNLWFKIATIVLVIMLLYHAWIGMWTVFTDYIKCYVARAIINTVVFFALLTFFFAALLILWGV